MRLWVASTHSQAYSLPLSSLCPGNLRDTDFNAGSQKFQVHGVPGACKIQINSYLATALPSRQPGVRILHYFDSFASALCHPVHPGGAPRPLGHLPGDAACGGHGGQGPAGAAGRWCVAQGTPAAPPARAGLPLAILQARGPSSGRPRAPAEDGGRVLAGRGAPGACIPCLYSVSEAWASS